MYASIEFSCQLSVKFGGGDFRSYHYHYRRTDRKDEGERCGFRRYYTRGGVYRNDNAHFLHDGYHQPSGSGHVKINRYFTAYRGWRLDHHVNHILVLAIRIFNVPAADHHQCHHAGH